MSLLSCHVTGTPSFMRSQGCKPAYQKFCSLVTVELSLGETEQLWPLSVEALGVPWGLVHNCRFHPFDGLLVLVHVLCNSQHSTGTFPTRFLVLLQSGLESLDGFPDVDLAAAAQDPVHGTVCAQVACPSPW